jgi:hypothetical protein
MLYLVCKRKLDRLCNDRLTSSVHNIIGVAKTDVWSHWTTFARLNLDLDAPVNHKLFDRSNPDLAQDRTSTQADSRVRGWRSCPSRRKGLRSGRGPRHRMSITRRGRTRRRSSRTSCTWHRRGWGRGRCAGARSLRDGAARSCRGLTRCCCCAPGCSSGTG